jgi:hypothetical protein
VITFQFDENASSYKTAAACDAGGLAKVALFPDEWRGKRIKDRQVLARFLPGANPFVTGDASMIHEHPEYIPELHAGLLVVSPPTDRVRTTTRQFIKETIDALKKRFPGWDRASFRNSILVLRDDERVQLWEVRSGKPELLEEFHVAKPEICKRLQSILAERASRGTVEALSEPAAADARPAELKPN